MPGSVKRSYTAYDVYRDYPSDDVGGDLYPLDGAGSPTRLDMRSPSPALERMSPTKGSRLTPLRRAKSVRILGTRPQSRQHVSVQTDSRLDFAPEMYPGSPVPRPPSQRMHILDRQPPPEPMYPRRHQEMDPITRQYYNRLWRSSVPETPLLYRMGRAGGQWRHVDACISNTGSHLCFIDGAVKQDDNFTYPPAYDRSIETHTYVSPRVPTKSAGLRRNKFNSIYSEKARNGFKYWYQEPKPIDLAARLRFKARQCGLGY